MANKSIFEVSTRKNIYNYVKENPGVHFRKISRSLNIPRSTLDYHLNYLVKREILLKESGNNYLRFYVSQKIGKKDRELLKILRETLPRNIVLYLFLFFNSTQKEIIDFAKNYKDHPSKIGFHLNKHRSTISYHLKKLIKENIIEIEKSPHKNSKIRYRLKSPEEIYDIIIRYDKSVLADAYGRFLKFYFFKSDNKDKIDNVIKLYTDLFPTFFRC